MPDGDQKAAEAFVLEKSPGLLKSLSGEKKQELLRLVGSMVISQNAMVTSQSFSGPLPPPEILREYTKVISNGAERIMAMAEQ